MRLRGIATASLLVLEYLVLTVLVDFAALGPAVRLVSAAKMLSPAVIGAGAAGLLVARHTPGPARSVLAMAGGHRPWAALAAHLAAFAATALYGHRLMHPGAEPVTAGAFGAWAALAATSVVLALAMLAPPRALVASIARQVRVPLFAFGIGLLSWRAVAAAEGLWQWLRSGTLAAVAALLRAVADEVVVIPSESVVGVSGFEVEIAPVCSGVDGLGLVLVFLAVWLSLARSRVRFGRAVAVLIPVGMLASLAANAVRISALVLLGASGHEDLAMGAFHSKLGWLLFIGIAVGSVAIAEHLPWFRPSAADAAHDAGLPRDTTAHVAPLLVVLATALLTSLWSRGEFDRLYGARVVAATVALLLVRRSLPRQSFSFSWVPILLGMAVCAVWIPTHGGGPSEVPGELAMLRDAERIAWIAMRLAGACVVIPIVEELAFRGFLLPWMMGFEPSKLPARAWTWPALLASSLAFGAVHESWLLGTLAGVVFAAARAWRGRVGDAIVAHVTANAGIAVAVLVTGRWSLWG